MKNVDCIITQIVSPVHSPVDKTRQEWSRGHAFRKLQHPPIRSYPQCPCWLQTSGTRQWGSRSCSSPPGYTEHQPAASPPLSGHPQSHPLSCKTLKISYFMCLGKERKVMQFLTATASTRCKKQNMTMTSATLGKISLWNRRNWNSENKRQVINATDYDTRKTLHDNNNND